MGNFNSTIPAPTAVQCEYCPAPGLWAAGAPICLSPQPGEVRVPEGAGERPACPDESSLLSEDKFENDNAACAKLEVLLQSKETNSAIWYEWRLRVLGGMVANKIHLDHVITKAVGSLGLRCVGRALPPRRDLHNAVGEVTAKHFMKTLEFLSHLPFGHC